LPITAASLSGDSGSTCTSLRAEATVILPLFDALQPASAVARCFVRDQLGHSSTGWDRKRIVLGQTNPARYSGF
jgi:hypothetical protein